ncbi:hypothetical protein PLIIFM63780_006875 [Purpureocillium lilacinum]|nr:hypothetical protein PLIIFM63780_006875 [Purpureocillium lilacinum]
MALGQILQGSFFTEYVKTGDALMLSDGRDNSNKFTLQKVVSVDLTAPSMVSGKRGFERLLRACETVFSSPVQWLFCKTTQSGPFPTPLPSKVPQCAKHWILTVEAVNPDPLDEFQPIRYPVQPSVVQGIEVADIKMGISPSVLSSGDRRALEEAATDLYEWLSLVRLQSPRTAINDGIDPYLSRYNVPASDTETTQGSMQVCMLRWQGLISARWFRSLVTDVLGACAPTQWFSASATGFAKGMVGTGNDLTLLCPYKSGGEYLMLVTKNAD